MKQHFKENFLNIDNRFFTSSAITTLFFVVTVFNLIEYLLPLNSLNLYEGEVEVSYYETYKCKGSSKYSIGYCEMSMIKLKGIDREFIIRDKQGQGAYLQDIKEGETVKIYVRHWFQYPLTFGSFNKIYQIQKGNLVYHSIESEQQANLSWIFISTFIWTILLIIFITGKKKKNE